MLPRVPALGRRATARAPCLQPDRAATTGGERDRCTGAERSRPFDVATGFRLGARKRHVCRRCGRIIAR
eukprot:4603571-Prymnesium_polylepis.1